MVCGIFSLSYRVQIGSGAHSASYAMGTGGSYIHRVKLTTHLHLVKVKGKGKVVPVL